MILTASARPPDIIMSGVFDDNAKVVFRSKINILLYIGYGRGMHCVVWHASLPTYSGTVVRWD